MTDIVERLRYLVALDRPENGGPYGGSAARDCMSSMEQAASLIEKQRAVISGLVDALSASGETKADYIGEFSISLPDFDENGIEYTRKINVPWTTIKEIMAAIAERGNITAARTLEDK